MRRIVVLVVAPGLALALLAVGGSAGAGTNMDAIALYSAGDRVDGLPLRAVLRRDDTAKYVSFIYGDCEARGDTGCAPPAEVQVWPACHRNLALSGESLPSGPEPERVTIRGIPGALFDDGTRLELETGASTVVVFGHTHALVLRIAAALRSLDGSVPGGRPLPAPDRDREDGVMPC